jgi:hypothetical protein
MKRTNNDSPVPIFRLDRAAAATGLAVAEPIRRASDATYPADRAAVGAGTASSSRRVEAGDEHPVPGAP